MSRNAKPKTQSNVLPVHDTGAEAEEAEKPAPWRHSPFADEEIGLSAKAPDFLAFFAHKMEWDPRRDGTYLLGQLLASAIVHGALLRTDLWQPWIDGLPRHLTDGQLLWIDLKLPGEAATMTRWFADPTTRLLILRWHRSGHQNERMIASRCLEEFLSGIPGSTAEPKENVGPFLKWALMHWRLRLPPLLLDQALGRLPTITLTERAWLSALGRFEGKKSLADVSRSIAETPSNASLMAISRRWRQAFLSSGAIEAKIFEEGSRLRWIGALTARQEKNFCVRHLEAALPSLSPGRERLAEWAIARLQERRLRPSPKGFAPSTVRTRLCSLLQGLYAHEYELNDFDILPDILRTDAVLLKNSGESRLIERAVRDFCRFADDARAVRMKEGEEAELEEREEVPEIASSDDQATTVSSKIISVEAFSKAVEKARALSGEQSALMITLAFRAGLRLKEIAGLQIHDFVDNERNIFELHVQRNRFRELKTFDSRRLIPLDVLLTQEEQVALRSWLAPRRQLAIETGRNIYCFGPVDSRSPFADSEAWLETILRRAVEDIEGCSEFYTFAHLRHSFSSYMLATLLLPEDTPRALLPEQFSDVISLERREILATRLIGEERLGGASLHAVSQIMGHTGIFRTLESYQHLLDLVLGLYVNRQALQPSFPSNVLTSLLGANGNEPLDAMAQARARARLTSPRRREASREYHVPAPPQRLAAATSDKSWHRLPLLIERQSEAAPIATEGAAVRTHGLVVSDRSDLKLVHQWKTVWLVVTADDTRSRTLPPGVEIDPETVRKWRKRYSQVLSWCFPRQGKRLGDGQPLPLPSGPYALSIVNKLWVSASRKRNVVEPVLLYKFLSKFNVNEFYSRFHLKDEAVAFAKFLREIGVDGRDITIAQGRARDLDALKSGSKDTRLEQDGQKVAYRTWDPPDDFLNKSHLDHGFALWISHTKHDHDSVGWSFDLARLKKNAGGARSDRPRVHNKANYAYRFAIAMMAIASDDVWAEHRPDLCRS